MNPGMPQSGMPSGASSGAPYFNGWSPSGGFAPPQQNYGGFGYSSPYGGMSGGFGSPFGGYGGSGFGSPFGSPYGGFGGFGYSSPFGQFQTPNFAAKGESGQPQSPASPATPNTPPQSPAPQPSGTPLANMNQLPPGSSLPPGYQYLSGNIGPGVSTGVYYPPGSIGQIPTQSPAPSQTPTGNTLPGTSNIVGHATGLPPTAPYSGQPAPVGAPPLNLGGGNYGQNPFGGLPTNMFSGSGTGPAAVPQPQPIPIPQAVPPQMMNPVSGPAQMLPQQMFNQNRLPGANPISPTRNMLIGGYR